MLGDWTARGQSSSSPGFWFLQGYRLRPQQYVGHQGPHLPVGCSGEWHIGTSISHWFLIPTAEVSSCRALVAEPPVTSSALGVFQQHPCMAGALLLQEGDPSPMALLRVCSEHLIPQLCFSVEIPSNPTCAGALGSIPPMPDIRHMPPSERAHSAPRFPLGSMYSDPLMSYCTDYFCLAQTKKEPEGYEKGRNSVLFFRVPRLRNLIEEPKHPPNKEDSSPFSFLIGQTWLVTLLQITLPAASSPPGQQSGQPNGGQGPPTELCLRQARSRGLS